MSEPSPKKKSWPRRFFGGVFAVILAIWIILEDWLWDLMHAVMAWFAKLPPVRWLEAQVAKLPPYAALIAFVIPGAILLPFKLVAVWLIAHHHTIMGLQVFIIAKVVGTALLARIFSLTKHALLTIGWFARAYNAFVSWKKRVFDYVKALPAYQQVRATLHDLRVRLKAWWRRRTA